MLEVMVIYGIFTEVAVTSKIFFKSDVLLLSKVRNLVILWERPCAREAVWEAVLFDWMMDLSKPIRLLGTGSERLWEAEFGLSCTQPLMYIASHMASHAWISLSHTQPLTHMASHMASHAQIGLSHTDRPLTHTAPQQPLMHRSASLAHGLSCTWPLMHRSASLAQISLSHTDWPLSHTASLTQIGLSCLSGPLSPVLASLTSLGLCCSLSPIWASLTCLSLSHLSQPLSPLLTTLGLSHLSWPLSRLWASLTSLSLSHLSWPLWASLWASLTCFGLSQPLSALLTTLGLSHLSWPLSPLLASVDIK